MIALYLALSVISVVVAYARPGVKVLKGNHLVRFTIAVYLFGVALRRRPASVGEFVGVGVATMLDPALSRTWILVRFHRDWVDSVIARSLAMTRARCRRENRSYVLTVAGREPSIHLVSPFPTVGLLVFQGDWHYTKTRVVRQLLGKSFGPIFPRYVIRLGGSNGQGSQDRAGRRSA